MLNIVVAGATGRIGGALTAAVIASDDLRLVGAVARQTAGRPAGDVIDGAPAGIHITSSVTAAVNESNHDPQVLVDFTHPDAVKDHVLQGIGAGVAAVIGTSGLTDSDYDDIDEAASDAGVGVLAAGNFSLTAVLLMQFAREAAAHIPHWEVVEFSTLEKEDAPSGTVRELLHQLAANGSAPDTGVPLEEVKGERAARGAHLHGTPVHSLRLPGHDFGFAVHFGQGSERLVLHQEAAGAAPYVSGALMAARKVIKFTGLKRGLDKILST